MTDMGIYPAATFENACEIAWQTVLAQHQAGNTNIVLPDYFPASLIETIRERYATLVGKDITVVVVSKKPYLHLMDAALAVSSPTPSNDGDHGKVPRPANAFILYRQSKHSVIKAEHPGIHNNQISKLVGAMWRAEPEDVIASWRAKADAVKSAHAKAHPDYSYKPRKASDKKRRMTSRKVAALQQVQNQMTTVTATNVNANVSAGVNANLNLLYGSSPWVRQDYTMLMFPMHPDDPMQRQMDLPTGTAGIEQFGVNVNRYNNGQLLGPKGEHHAVLSTSFSDTVEAEKMMDFEQVGANELESIFTIAGNFQGPLYSQMELEAFRGTHGSADNLTMAQSAAANDANFEAEILEQHRQQIIHEFAPTWPEFV